MYNGIGLQTARGSGTSGFIQKNLSYKVWKPQSRQDFLKELEQKRNNGLAPARKANPEIIEHERRRQIMIQTMKLKKKLEEEGLSQDQINGRLKKAEKVLREKLEKGELQTKNKDTHVMTEEKQRQYKKISQAFGLKNDHVVGSAFDFEKQRQQLLRKKEERRKLHSFQCPHSGCEKTYENQERLDRHTFHKHKNIKIELKNQ